MTASSSSLIADMAAIPSTYVVTLQLSSHGCAPCWERRAISVPSAQGLPSPAGVLTLGEVKLSNQGISAPLQQVQPQVVVAGTHRTQHGCRAPEPVAGGRVRAAVSRTAHTTTARPARVPMCRVGVLLATRA
jgi:hypothetical protein